MNNRLLFHLNLRLMLITISIFNCSSFARSAFVLVLTLFAGALHGAPVPACPPGSKQLASDETWISSYNEGINYNFIDKPPYGLLFCFFFLKKKIKHPTTQKTHRPLSSQGARWICSINVMEWVWL